MPNRFHLFSIQIYNNKYFNNIKSFKNVLYIQKNPRKNILGCQTNKGDIIYKIFIVVKQYVCLYNMCEDGVVVYGIISEYFKLNYQDAD